MLLSESRFLSLNHFIASVFLFFSVIALNCKAQYKLWLSYEGQLSLFILLVNRFYLFLLCFPSQDDDRNRQYARSKCKGRFLITMFFFYTAMMECRK